MRGNVVILRGPSQRAYAQHLIREAGKDAVVRVEPPRRTLPQNAKLHAMITDVSRSQPEGRQHTVDVWKKLFMAACGHEVQFEVGLNGIPFPMGFQTSKLSKEQMSELIEFIQWYGDTHSVRWSDQLAEEYAE